MPQGPRGEKRPADANQLAKLSVDLATDEHPKLSRSKTRLLWRWAASGKSVPRKNMPPERRKEIARKAAAKRWKKS